MRKLGKEKPIAKIEEGSSYEMPLVSTCYTTLNISTSKFSGPNTHEVLESYFNLF